MRMLTLLSLAALALAVTGSASADHDPGVNVSPWTCGSNAGQFTTTQVIRVNYGWGALEPAQLDRFLQIQSGSVQVTGPNDYSFTEIWSKGDATGYSPYFAATLTPPGGGTTHSGWSTHKHTYLGTLAAGTYTLAFQLTLAQSISNGFLVLQTGSLTNTCQFTVH